MRGDLRQCDFDTFDNVYPRPLGGRRSVTRSAPETKPMRQLRRDEVNLPLRRARSTQIVERLRLLQLFL